MAKAERKAAEEESGAETPEPVIMVDEFGNVVEVIPEVDPNAETDADTDSPVEDDTSEEPDPV